MWFEFVIRNIQILKNITVAHLSDVIKHGQDAHLQSGDWHLVSPWAVVSNSSPDVSVSLIHLPVELTTAELAEVVLLEYAHALLDFCGESLDLKLGLLGVLFSDWNFAFVWPVPGGKNLDVEVYVDHGVTWALLELLHPLLGHFDVLEHDLESLSKLETALFFQLFDDFSLGIL